MNPISRELYKVLSEAGDIGGVDVDWFYDYTGKDDGITVMAVKAYSISELVSFIMMVERLLPIIEEDWCLGITNALQNIDTMSDGTTFIFPDIITEKTEVITTSVRQYM